MFATAASDVWTLGTPIETIFPASKASDIQVVVRAQVPAAVLGDRTVVVKWSWISRAAPGVKAELSPPKILRSIYSPEEVGKLIPACHESVLGNLTDIVGGCERRARRIIVEHELQPLTKLTDPHELAVAFKGIIKCHHWLYDAAKILHRDISVSNLMSQQIGGEVYGVLNDFDLAIILTAPQLSTSVQRTGTKPYMARDLLVLKPPKHLYRHDLESLMYVLVFLACNIEGSSLATWNTLGMSALADQKRKYLTDEQFPVVKSGFERPLERWIVALRRIFRLGNQNRNDHNEAAVLARIDNGIVSEFDGETLGGAVTFGTFENALAYADNVTTGTVLN
ncbi:hypothetical protein C8R47DRAFT_994576 [Mycena vitilis]|nr:hypothetical protein C8R47DRAFT_994576 [Mycena vitilis]